MCGALSAYIGRATPQQACCPFACCTPAQPQTISHMFLECPVTATVVSWLCRLWQAMTGHMPDASVATILFFFFLGYRILLATILAASTPDGQCASDALLQTWHRLRLTVLHSIWTAARIAASSAHGLAVRPPPPAPFHHLHLQLSTTSTCNFPPPPPATSTLPWQELLLCVLLDGRGVLGPQLFPGRNCCYVSFWKVGECWGLSSSLAGTTAMCPFVDSREVLGRDAPWPHVLVVHPGNACSLC